MKINNFRKLFFVCLIPLIFFIASVFTLKDYGISWDEPLHFARGQAYLHYYLTSNKNYDDLSVGYRRSYYQQDGLNTEYFFEHDSAHPPTNDILAALSNYVMYQKLNLMGDIESLHLFNVLASTLLVFVVCLFSLEVVGPIGSIVSGFIVATYPLFFAESHFNIKDPAETAFILLTTYLFWKSLRKFDWKILLFAAIFAGVALGIKFNIIFLPFIILPYLIIRYRKKIPKISKKYLLVLLLSPGIAFFVLYIFWPYLWIDPINNFLNTVKYYKEIGTGINNYQTRFITLGGFNLFPAYWIIITTPPAVLVLTTIGIYVSLFKIKSQQKTEILWLLLFLITLLRVSIPNMSVYGGIRQIMEFLPGLALLSTLGFIYLWRKIKNKTYIKMIFLLSLISSSLFPLVKLHPNENVYFNIFIGGLSGAKKNNVPYWGNSFGNAYLQAIDWLNQNAEKDSKVALVQGTSPNIPKIWLRNDLLFSNAYWSGIDKKGEYLIELTHDDPVKVYPYVWGYVENFLQPVYEVKVDGVAIAKVWKNDIMHTRKGFENEFLLTNNQFKYKIIKNVLEISFNEPRRVSKIEINYFFVNNCLKPSGYIEVSNLEKKWEKLPEAIPYLQMEDAYQETRFSYYFLADSVNSIKYIFENVDSCVFNNPKINIYVLE